MSTDGSGWGIEDWAAYLWGAYERNRDRKEAKKPPVFNPVPMSPEQKELFGMLKDRLKPGGNPTMNYLGPQAHSILEGYSGLGWNPQATMDVPGLPGNPKLGGHTGMMTTGQPAPLDFSKLPQPWKVPDGRGVGATDLTPTKTPPKPLSTNNAHTAVDAGTAVGGPGAALMRPEQQIAPGETDRWGDETGAPGFGEGIGDYLFRNPGGNPGDYLDNGGQARDVQDRIQQAFGSSPIPQGRDLADILGGNPDTIDPKDPKNDGFWQRAWNWIVNNKGDLAKTVSAIASGNLAMAGIPWIDNVATYLRNKANSAQTTAPTGPVTTPGVRVPGSGNGVTLNLGDDPNLLPFGGGY